MVNGGLPTRVADALTAMRTLLGENDALAYLVNMAPRLVELHRLLRPTGSLCLHCDPTMSHYLKVMIDAIFDPRNFRNEITWQRTQSKGLSTKRPSNSHDVILAYTKTDDATWNDDAAFLAYDEDALDVKTDEKYASRDETGRRCQLTSLINPDTDRPNLTYEFLGVTRVWRWTRERMEQAYKDGLVVQTSPGRVPRLKRYLDEQRGKPIGDVWTDITPLNSRAAERLGYTTQKPLALLARILAISSKEGDVVLDQFCGCGTTVDAAQRIGRRWIGVDITYIAIDLIEKRLIHTYGPSIKDTHEVSGIPRDLGAAQALFDRNPFDFERWAVSRVGAQPNEKQVGDRGIDGVARFPLGGSDFARVLVSVKGARSLNPSMVRDLGGTVEAQEATLGVLITQHETHNGMLDAVHHGGVYTHPATGEQFPRLQVITIAELLAGKRPSMPPMALPYIAALKTVAAASTHTHTLSD